MKRSILLMLLIPLMGCAAYIDSFRTKPGQRIVVPPAREYTTSGTIAVVVWVKEEGMFPFCTLPDAANEISCYFSYEYFNEGGFLMTGAGGYVGIDFHSARVACTEAMWGALGTPDEIDACSRALLYYRFVVAPVDPGKDN